MSVNHEGHLIAGLNHRVITGPPELQSRTLKFWGVVGAGELRGERGARTIEVRITLRNSYDSYAALRSHLEDLDRWVGHHGTLRVIALDGNGMSRNFPNCTFLGFQPGEAPEDGPLPDVAETSDGGWWITGTLRFVQLRDVR